MPGLAGSFALQEPQAPLDAEAILAAVARVEALPGLAYARRVHRSPRLVAASSFAGPAPADQPQVGPDGRHVLLLHGDILNAAELRRALPAPAPPGAAAVALAHFAARGPRFVDDLRGAFSILVFDSLANELRLFTDHFGSRPLYFLEEGGLLHFGSEKKFVLALARSAPGLDPLGTLQVFAHTHNLGTRTFLQGVRSLPPWSLLAAGGGVVAVRPLGRFGFPAPAALRFEDGVEAWAGLLQASVRRCLAGKERVVLQLSGGLDSRAVACAAPRERRPFPALTRAAENPREVEIARAVAERLGFEHHVAPVPARSAALIPAIVWRTECSIAYHHSRSLENHGLLRRIADHLMGGQFGDVSSGGHVARYMLEPADRATFARRVFERYALPRTALAAVFTEAFLDRHHGELEQEFLASFAPIDEASNANAFQAWDQVERQANFILRAGLVNRHVIEGVYPFLDVDYFDFVRAVPARWRADQAMYRAVIRRLGPEIADIPNANDGLRLRAAPWATRAERLAARGLGALRGRLRRAAPRTPPASLLDDPEVVALLRGFLADPRLDRGVFNAAGIAALVEGRGAPAPAREALLQNLVTFAVGLPMFVRNPTAECPPAALPPLAAEC